MRHALCIILTKLSELSDDMIFKKNILLNIQKIYNMTKL